MKNRLTGKLLGSVLLSLVVVLASPLLQAKKPLVQKAQPEKTDVCHFPASTPPGHSISVPGAPTGPLVQAHIVGHGDCLLADSFGPENACFCASFLGISSFDNDIYAIRVAPGDTDKCSVGLIGDTDTAPANSQFGPNGLAYDPDDDRIYFAVVPNDCVASAHNAHNAELFFLTGPDFDTPISAGALDECPHDASWFDGAYYYLGPDHNELREVTFNTSGNGRRDDTGGGENELASVLTPDLLFFGDIAVKLDAGFDANVPAGEVGNVFMSAWSALSGSNIWMFDIEAYIAESGEVAAACLDGGTCAMGSANLQLAFHNDGFTTVLYGYDNATRTVVLVDESDGSTTLVCDADTVVVMGDGFNDTSPFETSVPPPTP